MNLTLDIALIATLLAVLGGITNAVFKLYAVIRQFENGLRDQKEEMNMAIYRIEQLEGFNAAQGFNRRRLPGDITGAPWLDSEGS